MHIDQILEQEKNKVRNIVTSNGTTIFIDCIRKNKKPVIVYRGNECLGIKGRIARGVYDPNNFQYKEFELKDKYTLMKEFPEIPFEGKEALIEHRKRNLSHYKDKRKEDYYNPVYG